MGLEKQCIKFLPMHMYSFLCHKKTFQSILAECPMQSDITPYVSFLYGKKSTAFWKAFMTSSRVIRSPSASSYSSHRASTVYHPPSSCRTTTGHAVLRHHQLFTLSQNPLARWIGLKQDLSVQIIVCYNNDKLVCLYLNKCQMAVV